MAQYLQMAIVESSPGADMIERTPEFAHLDDVKHFFVEELGIPATCISSRTSNEVKSNETVNFTGRAEIELAVKRGVRIELTDAARYFIEASAEGELDIASLATRETPPTRVSLLPNNHRELGKMLLSAERAPEGAGDVIIGRITAKPTKGEKTNIKIDQVPFLQSNDGTDIPLSYLAELQFGSYSGGRSDVTQPVVAKFVTDSSGNQMISEILFDPKQI